MLSLCFTCTCEGSLITLWGAQVTPALRRDSWFRPELSTRHIDKVLHSAKGFALHTVSAHPTTAPGNWRGLRITSQHSQSPPALRSQVLPTAPSLRRSLGWVYVVSIPLTSQRMHQPGQYSAHTSWPALPVRFSQEPTPPHGCISNPVVSGNAAEHTAVRWFIYVLSPHYLAHRHWFCLDLR